MASHHPTPAGSPLDLSKWAKVPALLMGVGGAGALLGAFTNHVQFGYSWLLAYMFFLSLCMGGLFLVLVHHLFDASWSVPIRRINEHLACLAPVMAALWIPIGLLAPKLYRWMTSDHATDHALHAKYPLFTMPAFYGVSIACFVLWTFVAFRLRGLSLEQDRTGDARCTEKMRVTACAGIFIFGFSLTLAVILWMKALAHEWFSTMYGVYYFAGSTWLTLATVYVITVILKRRGDLKDVMQEKQFYFLGSLFFAFTVFYAYVTFSQYFIIWNANMPEETFWYKLREKGTWFQLSLVIIFGKFFLPFLALLRIDAKLNLAVMLPLAAWAWVMHFCDMSFNIMPVLHQDGFVLHWQDVACWAFFAGALAHFWIKSYRQHPPFPQRDPRMAEGLGIYVEPVSAKKLAGQGAK
ncbi:MAG: hypothetical protein FJ404_04280 [Verrucomicrobia bacterium]|nr:hypothetical protein [Verrucomicrobiota bacterium]